jgi:UDP-glucose 6-dehydrogenase
MLNSFLATKVSFCVGFWEVCQQLDLSYEELRECFVLDERIGRPHTYVYDEAPYWDSHCFNKDVPAIANQFDMELMKAVNTYNNKMRTKNLK